jgi:hypothetical protein
MDKWIAMHHKLQAIVDKKGNNKDQKAILFQILGASSNNP